MGNFATKGGPEAFKIIQKLPFNERNVLELIDAGIRDDLDISDRIQMIHLARAISSPTRDPIKIAVVRKIWPLAQNSIEGELLTFMFLLASFRWDLHQEICDIVQGFLRDSRSSVRNQAERLFSNWAG